MGVPLCMETTISPAYNRRARKWLYPHMDEPSRNAGRNAFGDLLTHSLIWISNGDPHIDALRRRGCINHESTLLFVHCVVVGF